MKAIISPPPSIITGIFNIRFTLAQSVDFGESNIVFRTLTGEPLGGYYTLHGSGTTYQIVYYIPEGVKGMSQVSLVGNDIVSKPVNIEYDTQRSITVEVGDIDYQKSQVRVPLTLSEWVVGLTKKHFGVLTISGNSVNRMKSYLYGKDDQYELVFIPNTYRRGVFDIQPIRQVRKTNGLMVDMIMDSIEIVYPQREVK